MSENSGIYAALALFAVFVYVIIGPRIPRIVEVIGLKYWLNEGRYPDADVESLVVETSSGEIYCIGGWKKALRLVDESQWEHDHTGVFTAQITSPKKMLVIKIGWSICHNKALHFIFRWGA